MLAVEHAFCLARFQADPETAERLLAEAERSKAPPHPADLWQARAPVHLAANRPAEARVACERALASSSTISRAGDGLAVRSRELVEAMRTQATPGITLPPPPAGRDG